MWYYRSRMICVVCGSEIAPQQEHYANAWEKARKLFPCCAESCAQRFDPDVHWMPGTTLTATTSDEQQKLLWVAERRMQQGDQPAVVIRELLLAGVPPARVRGLCVQQGNSAQEEMRERTEYGILNALRGLVGLFAGVSSFMESKGKRQPQAVHSAMDDLDAWERRFGIGK